MLEYKGYTGRVVFDDEADLFHGELVGLRDVVTFQGRSTDELRQAFQESVEDYLEFCQERGEAPNAFAGDARLFRPAASLSQPAMVRKSRVDPLLGDPRAMEGPSDFFGGQSMEVEELLAEKFECPRHNGRPHPRPGHRRPHE